MKFLLLIERGEFGAFHVCVEKAEEVMDFFILLDVPNADEGDPPHALWSIQIEGRRKNLRGWKPRFVDDKSVFEEIERLYRLSEKWRTRYRREDPKDMP